MAMIMCVSWLLGNNAKDRHGQACRVVVSHARAHRMPTKGPLRVRYCPPLDPDIKMETNRVSECSVCIK
jgi:hypothetical protein